MPVGSSPPLSNPRAAPHSASHASAGCANSPMSTLGNIFASRSLTSPEPSPQPPPRAAQPPLFAWHPPSPNSIGRRKPSARPFKTLPTTSKRSAPLKNPPSGAYPPRPKSITPSGTHSQSRCAKRLGFCCRRTSPTPRAKSSSATSCPVHKEKRRPARESLPRRCGLLGSRLRARLHGGAGFVSQTQASSPPCAKQTRRHALLWGESILKTPWVRLIPCL